MKKTSTETLQQLNLKCVVYGPPGAGKTYTARTLDPRRTLVISAESGLLSLSGKPFEVYEIDTWDDLMTIWHELQTPESQQTYDHVFIDSLTELAEICKVHILMKERPIVRGKVDKTYDEQMDIKDWSLYTEKMRKFVRAYRNLPYNVIFTALEDQDKDELSGTVSYKPSLPGKAMAQALPGFFDEVFRLCIRKTESGEQERCFLTELTERYLAKDRSGKLDRFEDANWSVVIDKIQAGFSEQENAA